MNEKKKCVSCDYKHVVRVRFFYAHQMKYIYAHFFPSFFFLLLFPIHKNSTQQIDEDDENEIYLMLIMHPSKCLNVFKINDNI